MLAPNVSPQKIDHATPSGELCEKILDAAVEIFVESGYSQACTNHIADRAGVSVGSVYRLFPNKFAIYHTIAERFCAGIDSIAMEFLLSDGEGNSWPAVVDQYVDSLADFYQKNAALVRAWNVLLGNSEIKDIEKRYGERAFEHLASFLVDVVPGRDPGEYVRIAKMIFWSTTSALELSATNQSGFDWRLVEETKVMVKAYLKHLQSMQPSEGAPN